MKIGIISGSHRTNAESERVAKYIARDLEKQKVECVVISLSGNPLPLWDESFWDNTEKWQKLWAPYAAILQSCEGFVIVSPEWSGMVPPGLKNFFLLCSHKDVGHKPALIVGVSSSRGGAYPISELRESSYKNIRLCIIPEHLIIRDVNNMLVEEKPASEDDAYIRQRITYADAVLLKYTEALTLVRRSGVIDHKAFPNGM